LVPTIAMPDQAGGNRSEVSHCLERAVSLGWIASAGDGARNGRSAAPQEFTRLMMCGERNRYDEHVKTLLPVRNDAPGQPECINVKKRYYELAIFSSRLNLCIGVAAETRVASTHRLAGVDGQRHPCHRKQLPTDLSPAR